MRRLILFRHAKAQRAGGLDDIDRPLAAEGRADAAIMGKVLAAEGIKPDRVLVSAAKRTQQTWEELAQAFPGVEPQVRSDLYLADAHRLLEAVEDEADADTVLVVAHNPGIHSLAAGLLTRDGAPPSIVAKMERGFPTATAAVFAIDAAGRAAYDGLYLAVDHGGRGAE